MRIPSSYYYTTACALLGLFSPGLIDWIPRGVQIGIVIGALAIWLYSIFLRRDEQQQLDEPRRAFMVIEHKRPGLRWRKDYAQFYVDLIFRNVGDATGTINKITICAIAINNNLPIPSEPIYKENIDPDMKIQHQWIDFPRTLAPDQSYDLTFEFSSINERGLDDAVDECRVTLAIYGYVEYSYKIDHVEKQRRHGFYKVYIRTKDRWGALEARGYDIQFDEMNALIDCTHDEVKHYIYDIRI